MLHVAVCSAARPLVIFHQRGSPSDQAQGDATMNASLLASCSFAYFGQTACLSTIRTGV